MPHYSHKKSTIKNFPHHFRVEEIQFSKTKFHPKILIFDIFGKIKKKKKNYRIIRTPTAPRKKILFKKKCMGDYLRVGLHEYHTENPNGDFRFLRSCNSYRIWHYERVGRFSNFQL